MSIKVYQEKPENRELFLRLREYDEAVLLSIVDQGGAVRETLARITANGFYPYEGLQDREELARAGLTNALDDNGRLKVIGQEVEAVDAEKLSDLVNYDCHADAKDKLIVGREVDGSVRFAVSLDGDYEGSVFLDLTSLRDLHTRIGKHLAYLEKEGLA